MSPFKPARKTSARCPVDSNKRLRRGDFNVICLKHLVEFSIRKNIFENADVNRKTAVTKVALKSLEWLALLTTSDVFHDAAHGEKYVGPFLNSHGSHQTPRHKIQDIAAQNIYVSSFPEN